MHKHTRFHTLRASTHAQERCRRSCGMCEVCVIPHDADGADAHVECLNRNRARGSFLEVWEWMCGGVEVRAGCEAGVVEVHMPTWNASAANAHTWAFLEVRGVWIECGRVAGWKGEAVRPTPGKRAGWTPTGRRLMPLECLHTRFIHSTCAD
eukprot:363725-Chlamydomonas_euryale.AAC.1